MFRRQRCGRLFPLAALTFILLLMAFWVNAQNDPDNNDADANSNVNGESDGDQQDDAGQTANNGDNNQQQGGDGDGDNDQNNDDDDTNNGDNNQQQGGDGDGDDDQNNDNDTNNGDNNQQQGGDGDGDNDQNNDDDTNNGDDDNNGNETDNDDNDDGSNGNDGEDNTNDDDGDGNDNGGNTKGNAGNDNDNTNGNENDDDDDYNARANGRGNTGTRGNVVLETLRCQDKRGNFLPIATVCKDEMPKSFCKKVFPKNSHNKNGRPLNCDLRGMEEIAYKCAHHCKICCELAAYGCGDDPTYHINCENRKNLCHNMMEMMTSACAATCGFCNKGPCADKINGCIGLRSMCRHHKEFGGDLMKCSRTCGFCTAKCVDLSTDCVLAERTSCFRPPDDHPEENPYYEAMSKVCRKTCDLCSEPMPIDPDSPLDFPSSEETQSDDENDDDNNDDDDGDDDEDN